MIRFNYFEYNAEKEKVLRGNGELYRLSPYTLFWNDDFYYVIGWSDKHLNISSFRVDRMTNVEIADLPAAKKPMGWDPEDYCQKVFEMYRGRASDCDPGMRERGDEVRHRPFRGGCTHAGNG